MSTGTVALTILLLATGISAICLASVAGRFSERRSGRRAGALGVLGVACLTAMALVVWPHGASSLRGDVLWPLLVYLAGAVSGLGLGAFLVYSLVAAR